MQMKIPRFQLAHRGSLFRLQSAQTRFPGSFRRFFMTAWFAAALSAVGLDRRDMAVAVKVGGMYVAGGKGSSDRKKDVETWRVTRRITLLLLSVYAGRRVRLLVVAGLPKGELLEVFAGSAVGNQPAKLMTKGPLSWSCDVYAIGVTRSQVATSR
jgi:hypothetical protein